MRSLFSIIFQQLDMVIQVLLVVILIVAIIFTAKKFHVGNKWVRYVFAFALLVLFFISFILSMLFLTKPFGVIMLQVSILSFVAGIVALGTNYLLETSPKFKSSDRPDTDSSKVHFQKMLNRLKNKK